MNRRQATGRARAAVTPAATSPGSPVTGLPETIDVPFEEVLPASDTPPSTLKSQGFFHSLNFADAILAVAAVTAIADLAQHRHAITPWAILLLGAFRAKTVLLERMPLSWPSWLAEIVAFGLPSALMWGAIMWAT